MPVDYKAWFATAKAELQRVHDEKAELQRGIAERDRQIAALIQTINAIAPLIGEETMSPPPVGDEPETPSAGMTECVRTILAQAGEPLSATEVRDRLDNMGFDMKSYSNPLATIHTVLRRLAESGEIETTHELNAPAAGGKRFTMALGKGLAVEKIAGKSFEIGKVKGFIGVGRIKRQSKTNPAT